MAKEISAPFSARNQGAHAQIDNDFPTTARIGLIHFLDRLVDRDYVESWKAVTAELERIARVPPSHSEAPGDAQGLVLELAWEKALDFCERLHGHLACDAALFNRQSEEWEIVKPKSEVQEYIALEMQGLFLEEHLAFEFSDGFVWISLLVYLLTLLTFFRLVMYAVLPLIPAITSWYVFALGWALFVGTWRWRSLQKR
jgi:hypothetical protein